MNLAPEEYNRLRKCLEFTLRWEGGYSNDPTDPGGETKYGISKRAHPDVDIKNLTPESALEIYYNDYWVKSNADKLTYPDCLALLDTAVNCGVGRVIGWCDDPFDRQSFLEKRIQHYLDLVKKKPALNRFLAGWMNRVNDLKKVASLA